MAGTHQLFFKATDAYSTENVVTIPVAIRIQGVMGPSGVVTGEVTGDGYVDVVAGAFMANQSLTTDAGKVYVFAGSETPADATQTAVLEVASKNLDSNNNLGFVNEGQGVQIAPVVGDATSDIIVQGMNGSKGCSCRKGIAVGRKGMVPCKEGMVHCRKGLVPLQERNGFLQAYGLGKQCSCPSVI